MVKLIGLFRHVAVTFIEILRKENYISLKMSKITGN